MQLETLIEEPSVTPDRPAPLAIIPGAIGAIIFALIWPARALAQDVPAPNTAPDLAALTAQTAFLFDTFLFLVAGMVVMFMAAGFCMLEVGLVRSKNAATICVKNISLYAVAGLMVWLIGYNLIYDIEPGGFLGGLAIWGGASDLDKTAHAAHADWFFQMVFVATCASIVSGTLAERIRLWPFMIFVAVLTGLIYPIQASWQWGEGWLLERGFVDFAGSTLVHATGGWAALAGALMLGPRRGKFIGPRTNPMPGSNLPLATLGTFILWLGWFGFNGGSQLAFGTVDDAKTVAQIFVNTNMAACGGVVTALLLTQIIYKKVDLTIVLNGAIGGLVSVTADPVSPAIWQAIFIGAIGGVIVTVAVPVLDRLKIDDVVGAIPAHLFCGVWGTLVVAWPNPEATVVNQLTGIVSIGLFVFVMSMLVWTVLKYTIGIRVSQEDEMQGLDWTELGMEAYPEFPKG
ncbi:MAG: ammonium transporter [Pseudomonadota bacterium]